MYTGCRIDQSFYGCCEKVNTNWAGLLGISMGDEEQKQLKPGQLLAVLELATSCISARFVSYYIDI